MPYYGQNGFYLPFNNNATTTTLGFDQSGDTTPRVNATVFGDAKISTAQSKFGGASALFDGTGDYLSVQPSSLGAGDFTIEAWIYPIAWGGNSTIVGSPFVSGQPGIQFGRNGTTSNLGIASAGVAWLKTDVALPSTGVWTHVVAQRMGGNLEIYVNGIASGTAVANSTNFVQSSLAIGGTGSGDFNGYIDDLRIYKGVAKYTANFTPPTTALPLGKSDPLWQYCVLAMPMDGSNNSVVFPAYAANSWTPTNLSVAAGAGNDSMIDVPTTYDDGGNGRGNYCTMHTLYPSPGVVNLTEGGLKYRAGTLSTNTWLKSTIVPSGKIYFEATIGNVGGSIGNQIGLFNLGTTTLANGMYWNTSSPGYSRTVNGAGTSMGVNPTGGDILGFAYDMDNLTMSITRNGASFVSTTSFNAGSFDLGAYVFRNDSTDTGAEFNFGQRPFTYTPPAGFKALNTANLPESAVKKSNEAFDVVTYTGNGSSFTVNNLSFAPDLVWIKSRSATTDHAIYDTVRGATKDLVSNSTAAETTQTTGLTAFGTNGFTVGSLAKLNTNAATYVAWCWKAGNSTVTNTAGTITSQVRANPTTGFSVVTYAGNGTNGATVGHGLGTVPALVILKSRTFVNSRWPSSHISLSNRTNSYLDLSTTESTINAPNTFSFTSSTFGFPTTYDATNNSSHTYVAYCWSEVPGFSSFGSYTGNGNANGPFVYTGFRPAFVLIKMSSSTGNWVMLDDKRLGYNVDNEQLFSNLNNAEGTTDLVDFTANGFKIRSTDASVNTNAGTYIYAAFAEIPFKNSLGR